MRDVTGSWGTVQAAEPPDWPGCRRWDLAGGGPWGVAWKAGSLSPAPPSSVWPVGHSRLRADETVSGFLREDPGLTSRRKETEAQVDLEQEKRSR